VSQDPRSPRAPLHAIATRASANRLAPVVLLPMLAALQRTGQALDALCRGLGYEADDLLSPGFTLSRAEAVRFIRRALPALQSAESDGELGLTLGCHHLLLDRGALALGLMASPTLGDALALNLRFAASAGFLVDWCSVASPEGQALHAEAQLGNDDLAPLLIDDALTGLLTLCRQLAGVDTAPRLMELVRPPPASAEALARWRDHARCTLVFGAAHNRVVFDATTLARPLPMAHPTSLLLATRLLDREAARTVNLAVTGQAVERAIRKALPAVVTPTQVAETLHLSERTLRRRLADEGISYSALLDEGRRALALELIRHGGLSVAEVAAETGFADAGNFRRAYRRWTGGGPEAQAEGESGDVPQRPGVPGA